MCSICKRIRNIHVEIRLHLTTVFTELIYFIHFVQCTLTMGFLYSTILQDSNGCTALHYAVTLGHADATAMLLELGADPNRQDRKGRTPAHCGCAKGQFETVNCSGFIIHIVPHIKSMISDHKSNQCGE